MSDTTFEDGETFDRGLEALWSADPYVLSQADKQALIIPLLSWLDRHHRSACPEYERVARQGFDSEPASGLEDLPYLAVRLFKLLSLKSVDDGEIFKTLQSSGTTGQSPARVFLDRRTSQLQSKGLVKILQGVVGKARLPMLIVDSPAVLKDRSLYTARGAGIQGLSFFGRDHTYALDETMQPDWEAIDGFLEKYAGQPVLVFGFTYIVWLHLILALEAEGRSLGLAEGVLLHSGGWKKLEDQKVGHDEFRNRTQRSLGVQQVTNFYGMAEQVGSIFVECEQGHLHAPVFADVVVRSTEGLGPLPVGQPGLLQVLSVLPFSYPGHSLLTEDRGVLLGEDDCPCGRKGRYFQVLGRLPRAEVRGCSDTHQGGL
ncbi:LuxE/PaaK family acyltransferase [Marinobacter oulmenensis]|uniref:Acyl-protein synthetase LuxE domain-containing protein n=1 Tax=Marinobacter oulmenensis TaxID=643747 RepID=A0A840UN89_9GAMM|nr:acyl-protein synthetase [Marinobacter oulmenensis]MBB5322546.1 hypothetical protein [Marinobacter oulmenensis]